MPQTFQQLQRTPTKEAVLASIVAMLQGVGLTSHTGYSPGGVTITGVPPADYDFRVRMMAAGDLGTATYQYSSDGGQTWSSTATVPSDGLVTLGGGLAPMVLKFSDGPEGLTSFELSDNFTIELQVPTWPLSAWQAESAGRTLLEFDAAVIEDLYRLIHDISAGGLIDYAKGSWIDLLASNVYGLTRIPGVVTQGYVRLSDPQALGPFNLTSGDVVFESLTGLRFILAANVTVPNASTGVNALVRAESKGDKYNVANASITRLVTSIPGLGVNNPVFANGTWVTVAGSDDETGDELKVRCRARWAELAIGLPAVQYDTWAKASDPAVNRSFARVSPTVAGQVDLFIAGAAGAVSGPVIAACQAYVDLRVALTNTCVVASVTNHPQTITATVYVYASYLQNATAGVIDALTELLNNKKGIGATLYLSELYDAIQTVQGVRNANIAVPGGDVVLTASEVFTFTNNLTFLGV